MMPVCACHLDKKFPAGGMVLYPAPYNLKSTTMKEDERKKVKEPYDPHKTPSPPQNLHPADSDKAKEDNRVPAKKDEDGKGGSGRASGHLLNEDAEIDDETTI